MLLDATRHACNLHLDQALIVLFHEEHAPICPWFTVGIVGPLTPLPVFSVRSIGRSFAAGRRGAGALGRSIRAPDWTAAGSLQPLLLLRLTPFPSLSLPPSFRPAAVVRQSNNWYRRSRSQSFPAPRKDGRGRMVGGLTSAESGWYTGRASKRVRCLPLLPLIKVASLPLHLSLHDERSERRSGGKNR